MRDQKPRQIQDFEAVLVEYLEQFDKTLQFDQHQVGATGQPAWYYSVPDEHLPGWLVVHQTAESLGTDDPVYRVRAGTKLPSEVSEPFRRMPDEVNRYTTVGLIHISEKGADWGAQALLNSDQLEVTCVLLATGLAQGARSVFGIFASAMNDPEGASRSTGPSRWTDVQMDALAYDLAHLGVCRRVAGALELREMYGTVQAIPEAGNPYFGGGLLLLSHVSARNLESECGIVPSATDMNRLDLLTSDTPVLGGWSYSKDEERFTFVSFLPNFLKDVPDVDVLMLDWARKRTHAALDTCRLMAELDRE